MADQNDVANTKHKPSSENYVSWLAIILAMLLVLRIEASDFLDHADEYHALPVLLALGFIAFGHAERHLLRYIVSKKFSFIIVGTISLVIIVIFGLPDYSSALTSTSVLKWSAQGLVTLLLGCLIGTLILVATGTYKLKARRRSK